MGGPIVSMTAAHPPALMKLRVHTGDFTFDDRRDLDFLKLLADEIQDDHVMVITEGLQVQKALKSSFQVVVADCDMTDVVADSDEKKPVDDSVMTEVKDLPVIVPYSDDEDDEKSDMDDSDSKLGIAAPKSSPLFSDSGSSDVVPKSSPPKSEISSPNSGVSAFANGVVLNYSFVNAVSDDYTPKDKTWNFCELCGVVQDNQTTLIKVQGCGHFFCNYCFEWHSASQIGPDEKSISMIKCPVESCFNEIHPDHCVALLLQHTLDNDKTAALQAQAAAAAPRVESSTNSDDDWLVINGDE